MEQTLISVIVPLYHGEKYISKIVPQIETAKKVAGNLTDIELIFINDYPDGKIAEDFAGHEVEIKLFNLKENRGIHGARVEGLGRSRGEYVLFLDQDDKILPEYFSCQLYKIGKCDAVVCKLIHENKQFYDMRMPFESVINKDYMFSVRNSIISPGQVLIRKDAISEVWKNATLSNNGADDWLLWICMMAEGKRFALNNEILFEHVVEGNNASINTNYMINSEREVFEIVSENGLLSKDELNCLSITVKNVVDEHIKALCKFQKMFFLYNEWMKLQEQDIYISDYLKQLEYNDIAIYADSYIGKRLYHNLKKDGLNISFFIDMNAKYLREDIPIYTLDEELPEVDIIIISLVEEENSIMERLSYKTEAKVLSITELIRQMKARIR
ncbi:glycosyl transferase family 2 [Kineothrix alysoides]|uniref:Glycosyl transferase family 2 n=1 Tax=Kineothrix alysoides TaxID=1469948 RepID=A0A4R1QYS5_9FIRM|nr:glycosyltransferase family 2 protein [Kineothrix alysoides]TCL58118.1 glycosyl transferase family 2 [Kineothrix alysoides]